MHRMSGICVCYCKCLKYISISLISYRIKWTNYILPLGGSLHQGTTTGVSPEIVVPGAQYIWSMALEQISDWTSLHCPKNVKHTFPVKKKKRKNSKAAHFFSYVVFWSYLLNSPLLVSRTFLGLRSRHRMPCWCKLSRASRICAPQTRTSASGSPQ